MYQFWLGDILLPITPEKVTIACGTPIINMEV
jgi:hypothetical protein